MLNVMDWSHSQRAPCPQTDQSVCSWHNILIFCQVQTDWSVSPVFMQGGSWSITCLFPVYPREHFHWSRYTLDECNAVYMCLGLQNSPLQGFRVRLTKQLPPPSKLAKSYLLKRDKLLDCLTQFSHKFITNIGRK